MDDKSQKDLQRLARVRDNQRKSRARKQEYTRDLEQQLAAYKKEAQQKDIEHRLALQRLNSENRNLKSLLVSLGVSADLIQQYVDLADQGVAVGRKVAIPAMQRPKNPCASSSPTCSSTASQATNEDQKVDEKPMVRGVCNASEARPTEEQPPQKLENPPPPLCCGGSGQGSSESWPAMSNDDLMNTTMCAIADELINQYNTSGADIEEIRRRLWSGFRSERSGDGCRVQNQILFQVLDEISNNI